MMNLVIEFSEDAATVMLRRPHGDSLTVKTYKWETPEGYRWVVTDPQSGRLHGRGFTRLEDLIMEMGRVAA